MLLYLIFDFQKLYAYRLAVRLIVCLFCNNRDPAVSHALQIRTSVSSHNYFRFFILYRQTPNMGTYILDMLLDSIRLRAMQRICKAFNPSIAVSVVAETLAMEDLEEAEEFLHRIGCVIEEEVDAKAPHSRPKRMIMTKKSDIKTSAIFSEEKSLL